MTVAPMAKKDAVSKRLAEEIDFAKHIKNSKKDSPSFSLLDLASPDEKEKLAASLWSDEKDPLLVGPVLAAFKSFGLDHRSSDDWHADDVPHDTSQFVFSFKPCPPSRMIG